MFLCWVRGIDDRQVYLMAAEGATRAHITLGARPGCLVSRISVTMLRPSACHPKYDGSVVDEDGEPY